MDGAPAPRLPPHKGASDMRPRGRAAPELVLLSRSSAAVALATVAGGGTPADGAPFLTWCRRALCLFKSRPLALQ